MGRSLPSELLDACDVFVGVGKHPIHQLFHDLCLFALIVQTKLPFDVILPIQRLT